MKDFRPPRERDLNGPVPKVARRRGPYESLRLGELYALAKRE